MKNFTILSISILLVCFVLNSCSESQNNHGVKEGESTNRLEGNITLSGAFALYPLANIWADEFRKLHPEVRFNISAGGAGKGMSDALSGAADLGMFSREIKDEEKQKGAFGIAVAKDAVLPTINPSNPAFQVLKEKGISQEEFKKIFITEEYKTWGELTESSNADQIKVYTRSDASGAADVWATYSGGKGQESIKGIGVFGDPGLAEAVKKDKFSIGYNNVIYIYDLASRKKYDGIEVVPVDINNNNKIDEDEKIYDDLSAITKAIGEGKYPSPPARELYFISNGKPKDKAVLAFLEWVLTEGQKYIDQAGYIKLPATNIIGELNKLK